MVTDYGTIPSCQCLGWNQAWSRVLGTHTQERLFPASCVWWGFGETRSSDDPWHSAATTRWPSVLHTVLTRRPAGADSASGCSSRPSCPLLQDAVGQGCPRRRDTVTRPGDVSNEFQNDNARSRPTPEPRRVRGRLSPLEDRRPRHRDGRALRRYLCWPGRCDTRHGPGLMHNSAISRSSEAGRPAPGSSRVCIW